MESRFQAPPWFVARHSFAESPSLKACSEKYDPECKMSRVLFTDKNQNARCQRQDSRYDNRDGDVKQQSDSD
jgi:hypothetical protein